MERINKVVSGVLLPDGAVLDGTAADGDTVPTMEVGNAPPLVNALNIEVLEGEDALLISRFLDSGWLDTLHAAIELWG